MAAPKVVVDDPSIFPTVSRILNAMLRHVDPQNPLLVYYLSSIDSSVSIGVLPSKGAEGSSKDSQVLKKKKQAEKPTIMEDEVTKEIIPLKLGILKRTKKRKRKPCDFLVRQSIQESEVEATEQMQVESSRTHSSHKGIKKIQKP